MWIASSLFFFSLAGIIGLFTLKEWERRSNRLLFPEWRGKADKLAFYLKELLVALRVDIEKLPPEVLHISRTLLHEIVLRAAGLLRWLSFQAHQLADFVSHKHTFKRRAPRSEFLKKVIEHKNGLTNKGEEAPLEMQE